MRHFDSSFKYRNAAFFSFILSSSFFRQGRQEVLLWKLNICFYLSTSLTIFFTIRIFSIDSVLLFFYYFYGFELTIERREVRKLWIQFIVEGVAVTKENE